MLWLTILGGLFPAKGEGFFALLKVRIPESFLVRNSASFLRKEGAVTLLLVRELFLFYLFFLSLLIRVIIPYIRSS